MVLNQFIAQAVEENNIETVISNACKQLAKSKKEPTNAEFKGRIDLRKIPFSTIDGADARDFDDAVYAEKTKFGFLLWVAIADVAYYVRPYDELDQSAYERGTSVYFPGQCVPMLPEELSNNLCSLKPRLDRLAVAYRYEIDDQGQILNSKIVPAVIHSHARITYPQAQAYLDGNTNALPNNMLNGDAVRESLLCLRGAYQARLINRHKRFTADYNSVEKKFTFNQGRVTKLEAAVTSDSNKLIEEAMVASNYIVDKTLHEKGSLFMSRLHHNPEGKKLERLNKLIKEYNLTHIPSTGVTPELYEKYIQSVPGKKRDIFRAALLETSEKAIYSCDESGHFGLALDYYAHSTSPIRRYPDLIVQRLLYRQFKFPDWEKINGDYTQEQLRIIADHCSKSEKKSVSACRSVDNQLTANFYKSRVNNGTFKATIVSFRTKKSGKCNRLKVTGVFVSFDSGLGRALVPINNIKDDKYVLAADGNSIYGKIHRKVLKVGHNVDIILVKSDENKGEITAIIPVKANKPRTGKRNTQGYTGKIGQQFNGKVVDIKDHVLIVTLKNDTRIVDAILPVANLKDDYYTFNSHKKTFTGKKHKKVYAVGDKLKVVLISVCPSKGRLTLELA